MQLHALSWCLQCFPPILSYVEIYGEEIPLQGELQQAGWELVWQALEIGSKKTSYKHYLSIKIASVCMSEDIRWDMEL